jgi:hypothetical protein
MNIFENEKNITFFLKGEELESGIINKLLCFLKKNDAS